MGNIGITKTDAITSAEVAEMVGKEHKELLRDIRRYEEQFAESKIALGDFFKGSAYTDKNNQSRPCYMVTEKGCEFIAHKLTGVKGTAFTAKYVNRFHEMKQELQIPMSTSSQIRLLAQGNMELEQKIDGVAEDLQTFKTDLPMLPVELDEVSKAARRKGVEVMGGKDSAAYADRSLVSKVYRDIYGQIHRQFGVESFKAIKRRDEAKVIEIIKGYELPIVLLDEVKAANTDYLLTVTR